MSQTLPSDPDELRAVATQLHDLTRSQALKIEKLEHQLAGHRKARFGSKSESLDQLAFDLQEDREIAAAAAVQQTETTQVDDGNPGKRKHSRAPLPDHLERRSEVLSPSETCSDCGGTLRTRAIVSRDAGIQTAIWPRWPGRLNSASFCVSK